MYAFLGIIAETNRWTSANVKCTNHETEAKWRQITEDAIKVVTSLFFYRHIAMFAMQLSWKTDFTLQSFVRSRNTRF